MCKAGHRAKLEEMREWGQHVLEQLDKGTPCVIVSFYACTSAGLMAIIQLLDLFQLQPYLLWMKSACARPFLDFLFIMCIDSSQITYCLSVSLCLRLALSRGRYCWRVLLLVCPTQSISSLFLIVCHFDNVPEFYFSFLVFFFSFPFSPLSFPSTPMATNRSASGSSVDVDFRLSSYPVSLSLWPRVWVNTLIVTKLYPSLHGRHDIRHYSSDRTPFINHRKRYYWAVFGRRILWMIHRRRKSSSSLEPLEIC